MAFSFASGHLPRGPHSVCAGWLLHPRVDCPFLRREPSTLRGLSPLLFVGNGPPTLFVGNGPLTIFVGNGPLTLFVGNGPLLFVGNGPPTLFVGNGPLLSWATAPYSCGLGPPSFAGCVPPLRRPTSSTLLVGRAPSGSSRAEPIPVVGRSPPPRASLVCVARLCR